MPGLLINIVNGQWVASVANTNIRYNFVGDLLDEQADSVQLLAGGMRATETDSVADFAANIGDALEVPNGVAGMQVVTDLFSATDTIILGGRVVYGTVGADFLLDSLDEAGTALLLALA